MKTMMRQQPLKTVETSKQRRRILFILLGVLCLMGQVAAAQDGKNAAFGFLHLPLVEESADTPTGLQTTWSCVYFGSYPAVEIADSTWDAVDSYALQEGDLVRDEALYETLADADWQDDTVTLDGFSYVRVGRTDASAAEANREQHYRWEDSRPWHYFRVTPLRWRVLDLQENRALLIADRMPDSVPFHTADEEVNWQESTLRSWLNGYDSSSNLQETDYTGCGFIDRAFTSEERDAIITTLCSNLPNRDYGTFSGENTNDRLFILSNAQVFEGAEAGQYGFHAARDYDDPAKRFTSTLYAKCMGAWWSPVEAYAGNSFWFMRTGGYTPQSVTYVCDFGYIYSKGTLVTCSDAGVLPAMWIDLDRAQVTDAGERSSTEILHGTDTGKTAYPVPEIADPVQFEDDRMPGGKYTVWNAVSFGHYPQTEILNKPSEEGTDEETEVKDGTEMNPDLYGALEEAAGVSGTDAPDGSDPVEVTLDGMQYLKVNRRWFRCDPIIWRVLSVSDNTALLMADRCLDSVPYHAAYTDVPWENADLRAWLNGVPAEDKEQADPSLYGAVSFMDMAFTAEEQQAIAVSSVSNDLNYYFGTSCGSGTHDRVFILSEEEVFSSEKAQRYGFAPSDAIGDYARRLRPTAYAAARGAWQSEAEETAGNSFWFLRTNGYTQDNVVYVGEKGYLYNRGIPVTCKDAGIVPALRIRLGDAQITREEDLSSQQEQSK